MDFKEWLTKGFLEVCAISSVAQRNAFLLQYSAEGQRELHYNRVVVPPSSVSG